MSLFNKRIILFMETIFYCQLVWLDFLCCQFSIPLYISCIFPQADTTTPWSHLLFFLSSLSPFSKSSPHSCVSLRLTSIILFLPLAISVKNSEKRRGFQFKFNLWKISLQNRKVPFWKLYKPRILMVNFVEHKKIRSMVPV